MNIAFSAVLRILPYVLFTVAVLWVVNSIFQSGVERERNRVVAEQREAERQIEAKEKEHQKKIRKLQDIQQFKLMEVQNDHAKEIDKLNATVRKLSNRGLYITASSCEGDRVQRAGEVKDTGQPVPGVDPGKIRLPEQIESDLWEQARDAGEVVALYKACRAILFSPVCNVQLIK